MSTSAAERVYTHVKSQILAGAYPGGDLLTEGAVAEEVGVSRTPVREAMLRLEVEGMLRLYPKKGALVVPVTAAEASDVLEARALLETWAARRVAEDAARRDDDLVTELSDLVEQMRTHCTADDVAAFSVADRTFHEHLVAAAGNALLTRVYRSLRERQICISSAALRVSSERMHAAVDDHARLVQLLRDADADAFVELVSEHVTRAAAHLRDGR